MKVKKKTTVKKITVERGTVHIYMVEPLIDHKSLDLGGPRVTYVAGRYYIVDTKFAAVLVEEGAALYASDKNEVLDPQPALDSRSVPEAPPVVHDEPTMKTPED